MRDGGRFLIWFRRDRLRAAAGIGTRRAGRNMGGIPLAMKLTPFLTAFLAASVLASGGRAGEAAVPPPSLLFSRADAGRFNARAEAEPWVAKLRTDLLQRAESWPAEHLQAYGLKEWSAPWERGSWGGDYICPEHGVRLQFSPEHNICPVCQKDFHGWPYDHEIFARRHSDNSRAARELGLAYLLTNKAAYAAKAKKILLAYAEFYPALSIGSHKDWPRPGSRSGGRVSSQTLNESDWVIEMAWAYDMVRETMTPKERRLVESDVLRSASDVIARRARSLGNWTARHNAAHLAVGLVLRDQALVDLAVNSEFGFRDQLRRSITAEGVWYEGSWGYHFYALSALFLSEEMAARAGIPIPEVNKLRLALEAPLMNALPNDVLPNFNDSGFTSLTGTSPSYDIGFRLFGDRRYLGILRRSPRDLKSAIWGSEHIDEGSVPELGSALLPEIGFATLRAAGSDHTVAVKFGPHAGGHSHFDRLNFVSFAFGRNQAVDPGSQSYAYKTHKTWDRVTLAHNTLVVDESTQAESAGKVLEWHPDSEATAIRLEDTTSYPGVRLERLLVHTAGYTLDVYTAEASDGKAHRFDWIYHNEGVGSSPLALAPYAALPTQNGYQHLGDPRAAETAADWAASFKQADSTLHLRMLGAPGTTVVLGTGLGQNLAVPVPFALARRQGTAAQFVTLLEPARAESLVRSVQLARPGVVRIESARGVDEIVITPGQFKFTRTP